MTTRRGALVASLSRRQRRDLLARADGPGLVRLAVQGGGIVVLGGLIATRVPGWPLLMLPLGILVVSLFAAVHEAIHGAAFRTARLNRWVARACGFLVLVPPGWFRLFHIAHHRHTGDPDRDPERTVPGPATRAAYLWHLTGLPLWRELACTLVRNALGRNRDAFVPVRARRRVRDEARLFLILYALVAAGSVALGSAAPVWCWLVPLLLGQPFLRAFLLAEHTGCPDVPDMLRNSRTVRTSAPVRFLTWNMSYHAEHHALPAVPFHRLPALHAFARPHLGATATGYVRLHRTLWASLAGEAAAHG